MDKTKSMNWKYYVQKFIGKIMNNPVIPIGRTVGYSVVRSEKVNCRFGCHTKIVAPFFLHNVSLGDYSYLAKNGSLSNVTVGKFCSIGPNFCCGLGLHPTNGISTAPAFYSVACQNGMTFCKEDKFEEYKRTYIGNDVFIGANVTVLDGVHISDGAIIGAGAVVTKDIPAYAIAVGVPAKVVKYRFSEDVVERLCKMQWWNGSEKVFQRLEKNFWDVESFLK